jgi:hypothetical protein
VRPPRPPEPKDLGRRVIRSLLWMVVVAVAIPVVGFVVLIGLWVILNPRW